MLPIRTARLTVRLMRAADAEALAAYRNDPEVAKHQLWDLPYTLERARAAVTADDVDDFAAGMHENLAIELDGTVIGDVYVGLEETGKSAEIGFTIDRRFQGRGYATEAAAAVVERLFDEIGVTRVYGELDPVNVASQRTLEAIGLIYEGVTKLSFLWRGEWTDNMSYAATAEEFAAWRNRPRTPPAEVRLVELTHENHRRYAEVRTHHSQESFVSTVARSYGDALFPSIDEAGHPTLPWLRGIEADGEPVGFVMTAEPGPSDPYPYVWRLLVDRLHQRRGIGSTALRQVLDRWRAAGHEAALVSWVDGPGSPRPMYEALGFVPTGVVEHGETQARLTL